MEVIHLNENNSVFAFALLPYSKKNLGLIPGLASLHGVSPHFCVDFLCQSENLILP